MFQALLAYHQGEQELYKKIVWFSGLMHVEEKLKILL